MIDIDDRKKKSRMQKNLELRNAFRLQICYNYVLVIITKVSQTLECNEILVIGVILYLIISIRLIKKIDEIKRE